MASRKDKGMYRRVGVVRGRHATPASDYLITDEDSRNAKHAHHAAFYAAKHFDLNGAAYVELYLGSRVTAVAGAVLGFAAANIPVVLMHFESDKWVPVDMIDVRCDP